MLHKVDKLHKETYFSEDEIMDLWTNYSSLIKGKPHMDKTQFSDLMNLMGVRQNTAMIDRIYQAMDEDKNNTIEFEEYVRYFNILLKGSQNEKIKFCFNLIDIDSKGYFTIEDLSSLLGCLKNNKKKEDIEDVEWFSGNQFESVDIFHSGKIFEKDFVDQLSESEELTKIFQSLGNGVTNLMKFHKKSKYSRVVEAMHKIEESFDSIQKRITKYQVTKGLTNSIGKLGRTQSINTALNSFKHIIETQKVNSTPNSKNDDSKVEKPSINDLEETPESSQQENLLNFEEDLTSLKANLKLEIEEKNKLQKHIKEKEKEREDLLSELSVFSKFFTGLKIEFESKLEVEQHELGQKNPLLSKIQNSKDTDVKSEDIKSSNIFINDRNWGVVVLIMLGIEKCSQIYTHEPMKMIIDRDFNVFNTFEIVHPSLQEYRKCIFMDIAPDIFREIRLIDGINPEWYLQSLGPAGLSSIISGSVTTFSGLESAGKSGSFFYYTHDMKFMVKTIYRKEYVLMKQILPKYYTYITQNHNTLISKICGMHKLKLFSKDNKSRYKTIHIVIMKNIYGGNYNLMKSFDLKGSTHGRVTKQELIEKGQPGKDLNFLQEMMGNVDIDKEHAEQILAQLKMDSDFLRSCNIIDYSLLLGVIKKDKESESTTPNNKMEFIEKLTSSKVVGGTPMNERKANLNTNDSKGFSGICDSGLSNSTSNLKSFSTMKSISKEDQYQNFVVFFSLNKNIIGDKPLCIF